jgi:lipoprotein-releasing system ATP-binding protein
MSEAAALRLEGIERRYGRGDTIIEVLSGADLVLQPGESVALIAPSGAGKSTLLHIAGLLERPDAGEVHVGGASRSASSISFIICCRSSRRSRTSSCRR